MKTTQVIKINAKCSDMFAATLETTKQNEAGSQLTSFANYDGYVPAWFPSNAVNHYGDYVELTIDVETGRILNWKKPTQAQLNDTFKA
jgi:hypothetical protein